MLSSLTSFECLDDFRLKPCPKSTVTAAAVQSPLNWCYAVGGSHSEGPRTVPCSVVDGLIVTFPTGHRTVRRLVTVVD